MKSKEEIVSKIFREYDMKRTVAERKRQKYVEKVHEECPRLEKITNEINSIGFGMISKIMANPEKSEEIRKEIDFQLKKLEDEKNQLLKEHNVTSEYKEPVYECKLCNDTGFVGNEKCSCFKRKMIENAYENSNLSILVKNDTFDKFRFDFFSDDIIPKSDISYKGNMERIFRASKKFCDEFPNTQKSLFLHGGTGLGKTFLSNCIANEILQKGYNVSYVRATSMFSAYENMKFGKEGHEKIDINELYDCDLLIIDDLGTEYISKPGCSFFFDLLSERIDKNKKTIINSNLSLPEINSNYSTRITSRIYEHFQILHFYGEDLRIKKLKMGL